MWNSTRRLFSILTLAVGLSPVLAGAQAPGLALAAGDILVEARGDGYHLFIRKAPGASSVMLTEAFETPDHKLATYAFRSVGPNPVNDSEPRLLDGKYLSLPHRSLISSSPAVHPTLGQAFQVVLPPVVEYGSPTNPNSRYGKVDVRQALASASQPFWFSVRVFAKPYADYTGAYRDNAFQLRSFLAQTPTLSQDRYEKGLYEDFSRLGTPYRATGIDDALNRIYRALDRPGDSLDLVVAVDTTKSMVENLRSVKANLLGPIRNQAGRFKAFRIGMVFYRDYMEDYLTRPIAFTGDLDLVQRDLDKATAEGGGDIPEAVVEAVWAGVTNFRWTAANRVLIVLGDAPQHPAPRGEVTEDQVRTKAASLGITVEPILLPQTALVK